MSLDPLHLAVALVPLAAYCLVLGQIHLRRRPLVTTGWRDTLVLGLGISGLMIIGPMELFFPESAVILFGPLVWLLMGCLLVLLMVLVALVQRPRVVVFGANGDQLRSALERAVTRLEGHAEWSAMVCRLPRVGIQFEMDETPGMHVVQLVATAGPQSIDGWKRLVVALRGEMEAVPTRRGAAGSGWLVVAGLLLVLAVYGLYSFGRPLDGLIDEMLRQ